ncbi:MULTISPECIES: TipAS antibiotic-recognition domain-containing protein [Clostridium]|uniref:TipAS antibiotic-recognition domain-containing protein n=1 Tax=Clostridium aquiflavi TaxID=3073603 RepID=A0ABU1EJH8_9CLOT|nr:MULTISPECIES: TipAS antibiotic-recognition domain-containing protein [unclassified Clostridium]MDR5588099.1 TipAS antibiotic-recognition domain-containing protein [Clostridium sp. 5N-1]
MLNLIHIGDERFKENIDYNEEGTAKFISKASTIYCTK